MLSSRRASVATDPWTASLVDQLDAGGWFAGGSRVFPRMALRHSEFDAWGLANPAAAGHRLAWYAVSDLVRRLDEASTGPAAPDARVAAELSGMILERVADKRSFRRRLASQAGFLLPPVLASLLVVVAFVFAAFASSPVIILPVLTVAAVLSLVWLVVARGAWARRWMSLGGDSEITLMEVSDWLSSRPAG